MRICIRVRPQREKLTVRPRRLKNAYGRMCTCTYMYMCTCMRICCDRGRPAGVQYAGRPCSGHGRRGLYSYRPCGSLCSIKPYGSLGRTASVPRFCTDPRAEPVARTERALQKPSRTHGRLRVHGKTLCRIIPFVRCSSSLSGQWAGAVSVGKCPYVRQLQRIPLPLYCTYPAGQPARLPGANSICLHSSSLQDRAAAEGVADTKMRLVNDAL